MAVVLWAPALAYAQLSLTCEPAQKGGTGTPLIAKANAAGISFGWTCPGWAWPVQFWATYAQIAASGVDWVAEAARRVTTAKSDDDAFVTKYFVPSPKNSAGSSEFPDTLTDVVLPVWTELSGRLAAAPKWTVAPNPFSPNRAVYPVVAGKRGLSSVGSIPTGSPCDPAVRIDEGTTSYLSVNGKPDQVAVCIVQP